MSDSDTTEKEKPQTVESLDKRVKQLEENVKILMEAHPKQAKQYEFPVSSSAAALIAGGVVTAPDVETDKVNEDVIK